MKKLVFIYLVLSANNLINGADLSPDIIMSHFRAQFAQAAAIRNPYVAGLRYAQIIIETSRFIPDYPPKIISRLAKNVNKLESVLAKPIEVTRSGFIVDEVDRLTYLLATVKSIDQLSRNPISNKSFLEAQAFIEIKITNLKIEAALIDAKAVYI